MMKNQEEEQWLYASIALLSSSSSSTPPKGLVRINTTENDDTETDMAKTTGTTETTTESNEE